MTNVMKKFNSFNIFYKDYQITVRFPLDKYYENN